ncbi:SDR family NAD(P)-dependent oxidoreductase [Sphingomonas sp. ID0503]|uniref:SDR family NAD(P)-dependent oxidoreductase n=1 Tax=Sphingomonas sp. ID0503 TaxID=3399691 RepID=UPI003AFB62AA
MNAFAGKIAVVTGAGGGLGSAMARAFAAEGATVILADADLESAASVAQGIGPAAHAVHLDVTDEESWTALLDRVEASGELDILVNNAGIYRPNIPFEEMPIETWKLHFAVNSDGVFLGCKHAILRMKPHGGGAIVNIGSGMSIRANPIGAAYCASKAAVLMTTKTAAAAAGRYGIRVNAVLPGAVPTDMLMGNVEGGQDPGIFLDQMNEACLLGRMATPEDIARSVLFLCDPANAAITGVHLPVDGGNLPGN